MPMMNETWEVYKASGDHVMLEMNGEVEWYWDDESQGGRGKYFRTTGKGKQLGSTRSTRWITSYKRKGIDMNEKLTSYINGVFAPYEGIKSAAELKADLLSDLQECFRELKAEGKDDETAFAMTIESIGDIEQTVQEVANL